MLLTKLRRLLDREALITRQRNEIAALKVAVQQLRDRNEQMRAGMRRCVTCEYRLADRAGRPQP